jgi:hypothetical protein
MIRDFPARRRPEPADLVTCLDVMEHIEPSICQTCSMIWPGLTRKKLFVDIACKLTKFRWLSDGRN